MTKLKSGYFPDTAHVMELMHSLTSPPLDEKVLRLGIEVKVIHPQNALRGRQNWSKPLYFPLFAKRNDGGIICDDLKLRSEYILDIHFNASCLASTLSGSHDKLRTYLIEFQRPFGKSRVPTESPYVVAVYVKRDIFHSTIWNNMYH